MIDYGGRFAFFELAAFTLVRDHGVDRLSRHGVARVLATSISTVRRLLSPEADLRRLALGEVGVRRRSRLRARADGSGTDAALTLLGALVPLRPEHVAEELVWWRLTLAAPTTAALPPDHEHEEGPLHHRFAIASHGYVPVDVLETRMEQPSAIDDGRAVPDVVVSARMQRDLDVAVRSAEIARTAAPHLTAPEVEQVAPVLHAVVDGLGVAVATGRLSPLDASGVLRTCLATVVGSAR